MVIIYLYQLCYDTADSSFTKSLLEGCALQQLDLRHCRIGDDVSAPAELSMINCDLPVEGMCIGCCTNAGIYET